MKWISIKDKKPELKQKCIIWLKEVPYLDGVLLCGRYEGEDKFDALFRDEAAITDKVTHWMEEPSKPSVG